MNWHAFVANWIVNDYAGFLKRWPRVGTYAQFGELLRAWWRGELTRAEARPLLERIYRIGQ